MILNTYKATRCKDHAGKFLVWTMDNGGSFTNAKVFVEVEGVGLRLVKLGRIRSPQVTVVATNGERYLATVFYAEETTIGGSIG